MAAWMAENPWFGTDKRRTALANGIADELRSDPANAGLTGKPFFDRITEEVERVFGGNQRRNGASKVEESRGSGTGGGGASAGKTYAALQAGYEFVLATELPVNQLNVATDSTVSGNADMGSHIRVVGGVGIDGKAEYHVLMKLRNEWRREDERERDQRNAAILSGIFREEKIVDTGPEGESSGAKPEDKGVRYVDSDRTGFSPAVPQAPGKAKPLFHRPPRKGEK